MAPSAWADAGSAPYNNVVGIDPQLADPDNGDYHVRAGSPAVGYGCQTFVVKRDGADNEERHCAESSNPARSRAIDVSGIITEDTTWSAYSVNVVGDVTVDNGVTLTIEPGVRVGFEGYYSLNVLGTLLAVGNSDSRIIFTTNDPQSFAIDRSEVGCWNGIRFDGTLATNASSELAYCIIEHSKALEGGNGVHPYGGGAVSVSGFSKLSIENCMLRNNVAEYGGAIFLYRQANVSITGNVIVDNHALGNAAAIYCAYSYPIMVNNTIYRNKIHNTSNPYIDSCAVLSYQSKPRLANNIVWRNEPDTIYLHNELWGSKEYYTNYNDIEGYELAGTNINSNPRFIDPDGVSNLPGNPGSPFLLWATSPCVDAGDNSSIAPGFPGDADGHARVVDGDYDGHPVVDMGAYEAGTFDCNADGQLDLLDFFDFESCLVGVQTELSGACLCFDFDRDDDVDLFDFAFLQAVFVTE